MIKLQDILLSEGKENRIITTKFETELQKLLPLLEKKKQEEVVLLANRLLQGVDVVNTLPYTIFNRTAFSMDFLFNVDNPIRDLKWKLSELIDDKNPELKMAIECVVKTLDEMYNN